MKTAMKNFIDQQYYKASKTETLDLCQRKPFLAMRQKGILFQILEFIAHFIMMRQVFSNVCCFIW